MRHNENFVALVIRWIRLSSLAAVFAVAMPRATAAVTAWTDGADPDESWFNAANWDNGVPDNTTTTTINGASYNVVIDTGGADTKKFTFTAGALTINTGRTWTVAGGSTPVTVGSGFTININGGTVYGAIQTSWMNMYGTLNIKGGGAWTKYVYYNYVYGTINLGDATSSGSFIPVARIVRASASSTFRGWGVVRYGGWADNYFFGKMIADGWGGFTNRELLFQMNGISDSHAWRAGGNSSDKGWYAVNRAKLTLPGLAYTASVKRRGWGSNGGAETMAPTMVNSFWLSFQTISATKNIVVSLHAFDHPDVPASNPDGLVTAIWKFTPENGFDFSGATTNIFRYDHVAAAGRDDELSLWHYVGKKWIDVATEGGYTMTINTNVSVKRITVTGYSGTNSISGFFAVGIAMQPPPSGVVIVIR